jgi:hypothetical protein
VAEAVTHTYPEALAIFVKGFRIEEIPQESDILVASNLMDIKEISSISISMTVKNNPCTFNMTIVDTNNKFILPDEPVDEIAGLWNKSKTKPRIFAKKFTNQTVKLDPVTGNKTPQNNLEYAPAPKAGANYYEFPDYQTWLAFEYGTLEDPNSDAAYRTPVFYRRGPDNLVVERWGFDSDGSIILVVPIKDSKAEVTYQGYGNGGLHSFTVLHPNGSSTSKDFIVWKNKNEDFLVKYKDTDEQGTNQREFKHGRCKISPMDRVVIFMTKRFDDNGNVNQSSRKKLMRVFTGFVNTVQQDFSNNAHTITVAGEDVTKLMRLSVINANPSLITDKAVVPDQNIDEKISIWTNIFKGLNAPQVIELLTLGGRGLGTGGVTNNISGVDQYTVATGPNANADVEYDPDSGTIVPVRDTKTGKIQTRTGQERTYSLRKMLGTLFSKSSVHVFNPFGVPGFSAFRAEELAMNSGWQFYQADFQTRREIAYKVADNSHFVFYADRNGHIWFHPPRFNNSWILGASNPNVYVIDNPSIVSYGFIEDDSQVYSSVYVTTDAPLGAGNIQEFIARGAFKDDNVVLKYGVRIFIEHNPYLTLGDKQAYTLFAKSLLQRLLAGRYQGQVTVMGRPELAPGYPVYIPIRNTIYYVETVDHSFNFGEGFTTTLHLSNGRKPWEMLPEVLEFSSNDEVYLTADALNAPTSNKKSTGTILDQYRP